MVLDTQSLKNPVQIYFDSPQSSDSTVINKSINLK